MLEKAGYRFEWEDIKRDLKALQETTIEDNGKRITVRSRAERLLREAVWGCGRCVTGEHPSDLIIVSLNN